MQSCSARAWELSLVAGPFPSEPLAPASVIAHPGWKAPLAPSGPGTAGGGPVSARGGSQAPPPRCPQLGATAACQGCFGPHVPQGRESCDSCLRFQMDPLMNINQAW